VVNATLRLAYSEDVNQQPELIGEFVVLGKAIVEIFELNSERCGEKYTSLV
jgi:hypothetical protein